MDCDIFLAPAADSWKVVKRAEELGFRRAWFYDTQLLNAEVFVSMAAAAMQTSTIRLGTGVLIPSNRIAPVAASGHGGSICRCIQFWTWFSNSAPVRLCCPKRSSS